MCERRHEHGQTCGWLVEMTGCVGKAGGEVQFLCVTGDVCESVCWWKAGGINVCVFRLCARDRAGQTVCNHDRRYRGGEIETWDLSVRADASSRLSIVVCGTTTSVLRALSTSLRPSRPQLDA